MGSSSFSNLATELQLQVLTELDPPALLALSQVCRSLHEILTTKSLWKETLRSVCRANGLFEPSYPMDTMELEELQRAAFGPTLWHRRMLYYSALTGKERFLPTVERELRYNVETVDENFEHIALVPGGRYLISSNRSSIQLWDLGVPGRPSTRPSELIETTKMGSEIPIYSLSEPVENDRCLRFCAMSAPIRSERMCCVYEIGPLPESTTIRRIAQLKCPSSYMARYQPRMTNRYVVLGAGTTLLWDFCDGKGALWRSPFNFDEVVVFGDLFVGLAKDEIVGWTLPDLQHFPKEGVISLLEPKDVTPSFRFVSVPPTKPTSASSTIRVVIPPQCLSVWHSPENEFSLTEVPTHYQPGRRFKEYSYMPLSNHSPFEVHGLA